MPFLHRIMKVGYIVIICISTHSLCKQLLPFFSHTQKPVSENTSSLGAEKRQLWSRFSTFLGFAFQNSTGSASLLALISCTFLLHSWLDKSFFAEDFHFSKATNSMCQNMTSFSYNWNEYLSWASIFSVDVNFTLIQHVSFSFSYCWGHIFIQRQSGWAPR